ncbi:hypothetical protein [Amycolatopsis sp. NPDC004079]|uniref:hypothetical protein n=1 Tax=Amycolatopsis sp. NPDC004079 TaxID=3154549 RepID=UPI0033AF7B4D
MTVPKGSVFWRCSCRDNNKKSLGDECPKLRNKRHGQWFFRIELPPDAEGNRRPRRRGGYATEAESGLSLGPRAARARRGG